jgi:hypothetical protein
MKDPARADPICEANCQHDCPVQCTQHWELLAVAATAHDSGAAVRLAYLDRHGFPTSQKVVAFGGSGASGASAVIESLELKLKPGGGVATAGWKMEGQLPFPLTQNNAVVMADGNVVVFGGSGRIAGQRANNMEVQLYRPATGTIETVALENVPRHDHSTGTLMPNGTVLIAGGNRVDLAADSNQAIPVSRLYYPPYLFHGSLPKILHAPHKIRYGKKFHLKVDREIARVTLLRIGPTTHNWSWGNTFVQLSVAQKHDKHVEVAAPAVPGAAVPGVYMMYAIDDHGVPSEAQRVLLTAEEITGAD